MEKARIKFCGLTRPEDIGYVNEILPEYIGFVFWEKSRRYVDAQRAMMLRSALSGDIRAVGVFVDEEPDRIAELLNSNVIDIAQLHGHEDEACIRKLRNLTDKPLIKAFRIQSGRDVAEAEKSSADHILLDAGMGDGMTFDWTLLSKVMRPYFLAGGLDILNISDAVRKLHPFAVDVSSGIETDGIKDPEKMKDFATRVRFMSRLPGISGE